jgi:hypothetical protein
MNDESRAKQTYMRVSAAALSIRTYENDPRPSPVWQSGFDTAIVRLGGGVGQRPTGIQPG